MRRPNETQNPAATNSREFRRFLLMAQFEAKEIGARIAQARREAGLTQEQLAELAPFSHRSLQDYERGQVIPYRQMRDIAQLLGRPVEWFLHGEKEDEPEVLEQLAELADRLERVEAMLRLIVPAADLAALDDQVRAAAAAADDAAARLDRLDREEPARADRRTG